MKQLRLFSLSFGLLVSGLLIVAPQQVFADDCAQITQTPSIYQATQTASSAALYFTPVNAQTTGYTINYGLSSGDDRYNVDFTYGDSSGAITYTVGGLDPSLHYFFRVRAKNACSTGPYSDWFAATATGGQTTIQGGADASDSAGTVVTPVPTTPTTHVVTPVTGVSSALMMALFSLGLCGVGVYLFFGVGKRRISF